MDFSLTNTLKHINEIWDGIEPTFGESKRLVNQKEKHSIMEFFSSKDDSFNNLQHGESNKKPRTDSLREDFEFYCPFYSEEEMASIVGLYEHERNENLDEYLKSVGIPYIPRKMMTVSNPKLQITNEGDNWTIRTISMIRTMESNFCLNKEYNEIMPSGDVLKNTARVDGDSLIIISIAPNGKKVTRKYDFTNDNLVLTMKNENDGHVAKRYFKRL